MASCIVWICGLKVDPSFTVTEQEITGLDTPHALPNACFDLMNTYGTFLSSHNNGRCNKISKGSASAAMTMNSDIPLFNVLVASLAPFFNSLQLAAFCTRSKIFCVRFGSANG